MGQRLDVIVRHLLCDTPFLEAARDAPRCCRIAPECGVDHHGGSAGLQTGTSNVCRGYAAEGHDRYLECAVQIEERLEGQGISRRPKQKTLDRIVYYGGSAWRRGDDQHIGAGSSRTCRRRTQVRAGGGEKK